MPRVNEDDLNDALNTPTDELEEEPEELEEEPSEEPEEELEEEPSEEPEDEATGDDLVDVLLGTTKSKKPEGRVQRLANERREAEERAEAAERRLKAIEEEMERRAKAVEGDLAARRRQELEEMDPIERRLLESENEARRARFEAADTRDAQNFRALVDKNPQLKGLADDVEKELANARRVGQNPERIAVAKFLLGTRALDALQAGPKVKAAAKKRVENARGRPMGAGSNVRQGESQQRSTGASDFEKKYGGMKI